MTANGATTVRRRRPRIVAHVLLGLLAATAVGLAALLWERSPPPLAAGLSDVVAVAQKEFGRRVEEAFPLGSKEDDLIRELSGQGFRPQWRRKDNDNVAVFERSSLICVESWFVSWRSDQAGAITKIQGRFGLSCL